MRSTLDRATTRVNFPGPRDHVKCNSVSLIIDDVMYADVIYTNDANE